MEVYVCEKEIYLCLQIKKKSRKEKKVATYEKINEEELEEKMISYLRFIIMCMIFDFKYRKVFKIKGKDLFSRKDIFSIGV